MKLEIPRRIAKEINIKFHVSSSSGGRIIQYGRTDRQTNMTKLLAAFRNFAKAPKNITFILDETRNLHS
jgi:hypothetical protein